MTLSIPVDQALPCVKLVVLGDTGVGKTSILLRFVRDEFFPFQEATIGASFFSKSVQDVTLNIWDTAGQERYQALTPLYFRGAGIAVLVYDMTRLHSFEVLQRWARELRDHGPENVLLAVCGNKLDLSDHRSVQRDDAQRYAESIGAFYFETSARDNLHIDQLFETLATRAKEQLNLQIEHDQQAIDLRRTSQRRKTCCN